MHILRISNVIDTALAVSILCAAVWSPQAAFSQDNSAPSSDTFMQKRIDSAKSLIGEGNQYIERAKSLHEKSQQQIAEAKRLKGQAEMLEHMAPSPPPLNKLTAEEYKSALQTYKDDIEKFKAHASDYDQHLRNFQGMVGECHASEQLYEEMSQRYALHVERFHLPAIRPPHICGALHMNQAQAASLSWMMAVDQQRVAIAEQQLQAEENKLSQTESIAPVVAKRLENNAVRAEQEQKVAAEFGRLKQEYDLLSLEGKTLAASNKGTSATLSRTSVSAKLK